MALLLLAAAWLARATLDAPPPCPAGAARYRLVVWNVSQANDRPAAAVEFLANAGADAVLLVEAKVWTAEVPARLRAAFPHQADCHPQVRCSTLILSRAPFASVRPLGRGDVENRQGLSALVATPVDGPELVAVHLSRPWPRGRQNAELQLLRAHSGPETIVGGDFNMTPMFPALRSFAVSQRLALATPAGGSWPALPLLAIDHLLLGRGWGADVRWGPATGSDHRPIIADLCRTEGK